MAKSVQEIMNAELFTLKVTDSVREAAQRILQLDITAAPVLGPDGGVRGVVSLRNLLMAPEGSSIAEHMSSPAVAIAPHAPIEQAARSMAEAGVHHLIVIDEQSRAQGIVSTLDVIRALLGLPAEHPPAFAHFDVTLGVAWSNDTLFETERLDVAPDGPGVFALVSGGKGLPERIVWGEAAANVRTRLHALLDQSSSEEPLLYQILEHGKDLRFRAAAVADDANRLRVAEALIQQARRSLLPPGHGVQ